MSKSKSTRSLSTIEHVLRTANEKEKAIELIEKLLSKVSNFNEATELVLDDSALSFKLLKTVLSVAELRHVSIRDLINGKYTDDSVTAMHMVVWSNNIHDISEEMSYLLDHVGDVLIPGMYIVQEGFKRVIGFLQLQ